MNNRATGGLCINTERQEFRNELRQDGLLTPIQQLCEPKLLASLAQLGAGAVLIAGATVLLVKVSYGFLPLSLTIIARQQRVLKNLLHEAAHRNLSRNKQANDLLGRYVLAPLSFENFTVYRTQHARHHALLGSADDPDRVDVGVAGHDEKTAMGVYAGLLFNRSQWKSSIGESLPGMTGRQRWEIVSFWMALSVVLGAAVGVGGVAAVLGSWMLSKATAYHAIQCFAELCDHARLPSSSVFEYTRNMPKNVCSILLNPYNDNYHLTHHLMPSIPMRSLARAHALMMRNKRYSEAIHCDGYFWGKRPVTRTWTSPVQSPRPCGGLSTPSNVTYAESQS
ncbi:fatty acid desaturase [Polyangium jinanense]|uniref:Fatty acid desaturase n=1 Tax=Polyangium jinanense TaxID=2829994 RepID=A0A9X3X534_9BACT|nr:fatty acid desaturase [Polyangium jinanense]MDC3953883.1 fatty acid desaturase [Polyangium jinanense]MDC3983879.1 fatty acid desaturase [Polyangium jinanense]